MRVCLPTFGIGLCCGLIWCGSAVVAADDKPLPTGWPAAQSPAQALRSFRLKAGFRVELVASEPLVQDPIAFDWGPDGKLWVVEMGDYPRGIDNGQPGGRVCYLEDTNHDGTYDKRTTFIEGLAYPNGVMAWREGVLVSAAPEIFFAADTDHDGKADQREPLFTGFDLGNPQHLMNGFRWGLDNWVHCGGDHRAAPVTSVKTGKTHAPGKRDFRIRPDEGLLDPQTGQTQFVKARDDWGNWFGCANSDPSFHFALADQYLRRNPHLRPPNPKVQLSIAPGAAPVYPSSRTLARFNDLNKVNRFTSACGLEIYRDELLGQEYAGCTFVCEPVHNLVHREVVSANGATFKSQRAADEQDREFFTSTDNWFRPTMARTGPDGALWIADMYRLVIEHPEWIPQEWQQRLDLRAGSDKGRIYRIVPDQKSLRTIPRTAAMDGPQLVKLLESPNGPQRDMAQQMLVWRNDQTAVPLLEQLLSQHPRATTRLQALCTLDGLKALTDEHCLKALQDAHPGQRRHGLRLSETRLAKHPVLAKAVLSLIDDEDPQVILQLAYSLGEWNSEESGHALGKLALKHAQDDYLLAGALSSSLPHLAEIIAELFAGSRSPSPELLRATLGIAIAAKERKAANLLLQQIVRHVPSGEDAPPTTVWRMRAVEGFFEALRNRSITLADYRGKPDADVKATWDRVDQVFHEARGMAMNDQTALPDRLAAVRFLGWGTAEAELDVLTGLLAPQTPMPLQSAAVSALAERRESQIPKLLLAEWPRLGPKIRSEILAVLFRRANWQEAVVSALEEKAISPADLDAAQRETLLSHRVVAVRETAKKLLAGGLNPNRLAVLEKFKDVLMLEGDTERGSAIFAKTCASCHRLEDKGHAVGPDLAALTDKSPQALLVAILDPNRAVESKFVSYSALTTDGRTHTGLLVTETGGSIELLAAEGKRQVIARSELELLRGAGKSLMPEGFEKDLDSRQLADLFSYLATIRPPRKIQPGNQPKLVEAEALRGEFWLVPPDCEIYGSTLVLETPHNNLGYWHSPDDRAAWTLAVTKPGRYSLTVEYACAPPSAGNHAVVEIAGQRFTVNVQSTGGWQVYRSVSLGRVQLDKGQHRLIVKPDGSPKLALFDLKSIRLLPAR